MAASAVIVSAAPADAQTRYFMREKIVGLKTTSGTSTSTPTPTATPTPTPAPAPTVTYSWQTSGWSGGCGSNVYQIRQVYCQASTGGSVPDSNCSSAGAKPATSMNGQDYSQCTYQLHDHGAGACTNGSRPHYYDCMRSDGTDGFYVSYCRSGWNNPMPEAC
jgi:hypothetical protein